MSFYYNLCSSSSGNASFVGSREAGLLFDAGVGIRNFKKLLEAAGLTPQAVKAIFITHEHGDHVRGLEAISTRHNIPVYGAAEALDALLGSGRISGNQELHALKGPVSLAGFEVIPFPTSHDSPGSVGYRVHTPDGASVGICTDLGYASDAVLTGISGCDFVMLEANYDEAMLKCGPYPPWLKRRIAGQQGHLSNRQCAEVLGKLIPAGTKQVTLAHLSEENNLPALAYDTVSRYLSEQGLQAPDDYRMDVLPKVGSGKVVVLPC